MWKQRQGEAKIKMGVLGNERSRKQGIKSRTEKTGERQWKIRKQLPA